MTTQFADNEWAGTPLAGWADALRESDAAMNETQAASRRPACRETETCTPGDPCRACPFLRVTPANEAGR